MGISDLCAQAHDLKKGSEKEEKGDEIDEIRGVERVRNQAQAMMDGIFIAISSISSCLPFVSSSVGIHLAPS